MTFRHPRPMTACSPQQGFSLVEVLVSVTIGLFIGLAVTAFAIALIRSNTDTIRTTRVSQDLRVSVTLLARELRRAGYNQNAIRLVANESDYASNYTDLVWGDTFATAATDCPEVAKNAAASSCLLFSYDRAGINDGATAPSTQEWKGFRRVELADRAVLQMFVGDAGGDPPSCDDAADAAGWNNLTPPGITVVGLSLANNQSDPIALTSIPNATVQVRTVGVQLEEQAIGSTKIQRICDEDKIRADQVAFTAP